jgi:hypothetical protein
MATTLPPSSTDCLEILGALTSWNPKGMCRPVAGKLYLLPTEQEANWTSQRVYKNVLDKRKIASIYLDSKPGPFSP